MRTILVTGASGFVGWKTAEKLMARGDVVIGVDNLNPYYDVQLKEWRLKHLQQSERFQFYQADIEDIEAVRRILTEHPVTAIINLAARAGVRQSIENPHVYYTTNVLGNLNLLELCHAFGIQKYVLASTSSLYAGDTMPFREDAAVNRPISPYAASKKAAEVCCYTYHHLYHLDVTIVRYFTVYGPAGRPDMSIYRFIHWIDAGQPLILFGDGTQSRDFTYIDDIADGTVRALSPLGYEIINLGNSTPHTMNEAIQLIEKYLNKQAIVNQQPFQQTDMRATWADISKAKALLQWEPHVPFDEGLRRTVEWYRIHS